MRRLAPILALLIFFTIASCHTRVVSSNRPMQNNSLELYQKYTFQTNDARIIKMEVLKMDAENIYGKTKTGEEVVLSKSNVREAKKVDVLSSIAVGLTAIAAVVFVPI